MDEKQRIILDATRRLLNRHGLHGTSVSMIVKESGIPTGTIYRYFKDKETLINALHQDLITQISYYICKDVRSDLPLRQQLEILINNVIACNFAYPDRFVTKAMLDLLPCENNQTKSCVEEYFRPLLDFAKQGIEQGIFKPLPVEVLLCLGLGPIEWYFHIYKRHFSDLTNEQRNTFIQACWDGLTIHPHANSGEIL